MKKIVSVLSVAALTLSAVFAADVSLKYNMKGSLYEETNKKEVKAGSETISQERSILNQSGYADAESDIVITAKNDFAGFVLDVQPNATKKSKLADGKTEVSKLKEYYAWMNFGNLQLTTGKWKSRYTNLLDAEQGEWEDDDFMRYPLGVVGGKMAYDVDNLTATVKQKTDAAGNSKYFKQVETTQKVSTALAYTVRPNDDTYFMIKGVAVDNKWGGTGKWDSNRSYADGAYDIQFFSGFAAEAALHTAGLDLNLVVKSMVRDEFSFAAFVAPKLGDTSLLFGFTAGLNLEDNATHPKDNYEHNYHEFGIDFRAIFKLSDALTLTTMNNLSVIDEEKAKDQKWDVNTFHLWDMVSLSYKASDKIKAQLTAEAECDLLHNEKNSAGDGTETKNVRDNGGFTLSVIPGLVYSFNQNASLTAGFKFQFAEIGASTEFKDSDHTITTKISIPVVFAVAL